MKVPSELRYTEDHEWVKTLDGNRIRIGITDYAQDSLGEVVFADLPSVGTDAGPGDTIAEVESTKSVAEVFAPLAGTVVAANAALEQTPELINDDPYGEGWFVEMELSDPSALDGLLDADAYRALTED